MMYVHADVLTGDCRKDMRVLLVHLFWIFTQCAASFTVTVPSSPVLVVRGQTAFLPCEFVSDHNLSHLVITWQRQEDQRVVHSYYYQTDQLDRQSSDYHNRTWLNHNLILEGNASLSIANFGMKDAGNYLCIVSNTKGTDRGIVPLVYAAVYSEPRLSIHLNSPDVTVQYETEGYPKPEVMWLGSGGQDIPYHLEVSSTLDEGLYFLKSSYVTQNPSFNITFFLKNPVAHQEIQRHVIFNFETDIWLVPVPKTRVHTRNMSK
ncbi:butyrophilin subfamily 3 member A2 isoform X2 [Xyrauchen texanus]|uniref:butyrophilin subfamily 3 member A2 isoform X2 n=1 Tax=Xyrauchen texanus TaxID=154827 RepID=UPI002241A217|nr:butyrophilin subfamily 3 member A2 isoform X2 [Xyrauchen texanus]